MQTIITSRQRYATENAEDEENEETCRESLHHARKKWKKNKKYMSECDSNSEGDAHGRQFGRSRGNLVLGQTLLLIGCYRHSVLEQKPTGSRRAEKM